MDKQKLVEGWLDDEQEQEMEKQRKAKEEEEKRLAEEKAQRNRPVSMKVLVERAMHLPTVQDDKGYTLYSFLTFNHYLPWINHSAVIIIYYG